MGPLNGVRLLEMGGIGPAPFAAMLLADMGADVVRVDRPAAADLGIAMPARFEISNRNKRSIAIDLKAPQGVETVLSLAARADILIEGFRPGVMERLGLGPQTCRARNPALVYGRMTGWGQDGPLAQTAGHDLNYIAMTGALQAIGASRQPAVPLNLIGDQGGGALYLAMGVLAALVEARASGAGQVVDAAMVDGVTSMMGMYHALHQQGNWTIGRERNLLDGGAPFYGVYETRDGGHVSVAAVEGRFYRELVIRMGLDPAELPPQNDPGHWPQTRARFAEVFASRTRNEWTAIMEGSDACFAPVLDMAEARTNPVAFERRMYEDVGGVVHPLRAPRFERADQRPIAAPPEPGRDNAAVLSDWGFGDDAIHALDEQGVIVGPAVVPAD